MDENAPPSFSAPPPPPPVPPPPVIAPAMPPPPRRGRGWMVIAIVLMFLLAISALYNLVNLAGSFFRSRAKFTRSGGPRLEEVVTEDNDASDKIAVVEIDGIITSRVIDQGGYNMVEVVKAELKRADEDRHVKAVVLKVDSPGGEVLASDEIYRAIADFQKESEKPVVASMGSLAASGGYYVSAPCQWIEANELTLTGSIGVIMHTWNYRALMDKVGLRPEVYKSGRFKDMLSGEREPGDIPPEERDMLQSLINETYSKFTNVVAQGRSLAHQKNKDQGQALSTNWPEYADGRVLSGSEALKLGFVDHLGNFDVAVKRARTLAGISSANLIEYQQRFDISDLFRLFGQSESRVVKIDLGMDPPKLQAGQLYFLAPSFAR